MIHLRQQKKKEKTASEKERNKRENDGGQEEEVHTRKLLDYKRGRMHWFVWLGVPAEAVRGPLVCFHRFQKFADEAPALSQEQLRAPAVLHNRGGATETSIYVFTPPFRAFHSRHLQQSCLFWILPRMTLTLSLVQCRTVKGHIGESVFSCVCFFFIMLKTIM